jgi:S-adenosylmethionine-diacylglycerol 3-amino-3-carboxypropyl transferase
VGADRRGRTGRGHGGGRLKPPYNFGMSQEDERTEASALHLPGGRVLSIASAGDMALSLAALGADLVVATDIEAGQVWLGELKLAAVRVLDREDAIRFLGFLPACRADRERWLTALLPCLPAPAREFWKLRPWVAGCGPIWAGRYERYLRRLRSLVTPLAGRAFVRLVGSATLDEQARVFAASFDRPLVRAMFRVAFTPRLYSVLGMDPRGLQHRGNLPSPGVRFFERFRAMCLDSPSRLNPLLQLHLLGRVRGVNVVPEYLTERGFRALRESGGTVSFVHASVFDHLLSSHPGTYDRFHLSNVPDWLPANAFGQLVELIVERAATPARVVWRSLHADPSLPAALLPRIRVDDSLGAELQSRDRFPLYRISPAEIRA